MSDDLERYTRKELKAFILLDLLKELKQNGRVNYIEFTNNHGFGRRKRFYYLEIINKLNLDIEIKREKGKCANTVIIVKSFNNFDKAIESLNKELENVALFKDYKKENDTEGKFEIENILKKIKVMDLTICEKDKAIHRLKKTLKPTNKKEEKAIIEAYEIWRKCYISSKSIASYIKRY